MHHRFDSRLAVTLASIIAFAAVACSAAPAPVSELDAPKNKAPSKTDDSDSPTTETNPTNPAPGPSTPAPASGECGKKADGDACFECCYQKSPAEIDKVEEIFAACICTTPGACKADCADTYCSANNDTPPSAACEACLNTNAAPCKEKADVACKASPACMAFDACAESECSKFPETP
jgi:hypothetical protein